MTYMLYKINALVVTLYNYLMKTRLININNKVVRRIRAAFLHTICFGCEASFGSKNPTRKFYVIRCPQSTLGFFGLYNYVVSHIKIAETMGREPIADWKYYPNSAITDEKRFAKDNAWDYFFEPMIDISLDEVYQSKNVWMSSGESNSSLGEAFDEEALLESREIINKYMRPSKSVMERYERRYLEFGMDSEKILGVLCRGTDFAATKPQFHAICPDAEQTIDFIEKMMKEWGYYEHIFVATEDKNILNALKMKYGSRLLVNQTTMIDYSGDKWLNECYANIDAEKCMNISLEYFVSVILLSKCDALIAPLVGGTLGAMRMKGKYEKIYLTKLGQYN